MEKLKDKITVLSLEQDQLLITPNERTPVRLAEIAEEKKLIGRLFAAAKGDVNIAKGMLDSIFKEITLEMKLMNISPEVYALKFKAWWSVASVILSKEEIEAIAMVSIQYELPSIFELIAGAFSVLKQKLFNFSNKYVYRDEEI